MFLYFLPQTTGEYSVLAGEEGDVGGILPNLVDLTLSLIDFLR